MVGLVVHCRTKLLILDIIDIPGHLTLKTICVRADMDTISEKNDKIAQKVKEIWRKVC